MLNDFYLLLEEAVSVKVYENNRCELQPIAFLKQFCKLFHALQFYTAHIHIQRPQRTKKEQQQQHPFTLLKIV